MVSRPPTELVDVKLPVRLTTAAGSTIRQAEALVEALIRRAGSEGRL
jgi:hypothetical protein